MPRALPGPEPAGRRAGRGGLAPSLLAGAGGSAGGPHACPPGGESALTSEWESRASVSPRRTPFGPKMRRHRCLTHPKAAAHRCRQLTARNRAVPPAYCLSPAAAQPRAVVRVSTEEASLWVLRAVMSRKLFARVGVWVGLLDSNLQIKRTQANQ